MYNKELVFKIFEIFFCYKDNFSIDHLDIVFGSRFLNKFLLRVNSADIPHFRFKMMKFKQKLLQGVRNFALRAGSMIYHARASEQ